MAFCEIGKLDQTTIVCQETLKMNQEHAQARDFIAPALQEKHLIEEVSEKTELRCSQPSASPKRAFDKVHSEDHSSFDRTTFIVCAMFTPHSPKLFQYASRLITSCKKYELPYSIYEVPSIHKSITPYGQDDLTFTKANFILFNMKRFPKKNVLYLDIDVFFVEYPDVIAKISDSDYDFAIYNWLNDEHNEAYIPINRSLEAGNIYSDFYIFSHCIYYLSAEQLLCSGAVQFYKNTLNATYLLEAWHNVIAQNPAYADDESLDYAFNNFVLGRRDLKTYWLDKAYLRYPWWPYAKPVILHPDLPSSGRQLHLTEIDNLKRFYPERCQPKSNSFLFPPDCIIDTKNRLLLKIKNDQIVDAKKIEQNFWIYPNSGGS